MPECGMAGVAGMGRCKGPLTEFGYCEYHRDQARLRAVFENDLDSDRPRLRRGVAHRGFVNIPGGRKRSVMYPKGGG